MLRPPLDFLVDDEAPLLFFAEDFLLDVLAVLGFDAVFERDDDAPDAAFFDVVDDERLLPLSVRELLLDFDAVLRPPDELEFARPLPLAFFPVDFFVPDDVPDELLLPPPLVFEPVVERDDDDCPQWVVRKPEEDRDHAHRCDHDADDAGPGGPIEKSDPGGRPD